MLKEFKEFAFKGNVMDMAVGIIIGGAFGTVVKSLVDHVLMPPLGMLIAGIDFANMKWVITPAIAEVKTGDTIVSAAKAEVAIGYGQFITDFISFILIAFAVFLVIKKMMALFEKKKEAAPAPAPNAQEVLLTEIRDLLKEKS